MDRIGQYRILTNIHGYRPLFRAIAADGRPVASKTIPVEGLEPEERARFIREAEICHTGHRGDRSRGQRRSPELSPCCAGCRGAAGSA